MTLTRLWMPSPNYSSRGGTAVRLAVVHTAEGALSIQSLGAFFANPDSQVSSHTGIDDTPDTVGEYLTRASNAWTAAAANSFSIQTELCAFASWDRPTWLSHPTMLANLTAWLQEECAFFGIPWVKLTAEQAQGGQAGICGHQDLGVAGGNHSDPGPDFPWDVVLAMEAGTTRKGRSMIAATSTGDGYWTVTSDGAVYAFGDAVYAGGAHEPDVVTGEIIGIAGKGTDGYWLHASDGAVFSFGSAVFYGRPDRT